MKKKLTFDLQLFAEAATTDGAAEVATDTPNKTGDAATDQGTTTDDKKPATAAEPDKKDEPKYTDADLDRIINKKFAELQAKKDKDVAEAQKLANMNAQEKAEYTLQQEKDAHAATQKELDEYKRKDTLSEMAKTARKMLSDDGISVSDELLSLIITTDAEQTAAAVKSFSRLFKAAVESAAKDAARGTTPKVITNDDSLDELDKRIAKYK